MKALHCVACVVTGALAVALYDNLQNAPEVGLKVSGAVRADEPAKPTGHFKFDRDVFFKLFEESQRLGKLSAAQKKNVDQLLGFIEADPDVSDVCWVAYMLATVKHETARKWVPLDEYGKGRDKPYGIPRKVMCGGKEVERTYYGRGYVQLTHYDNYERMGKHFKSDLVCEPELANDPELAYKIMSYGMRNGSFTGKKLSQYRVAGEYKYMLARQIINGLDNAQEIAFDAVALEAVLRKSEIKPAKP